jgi:hypothetical protein
VKPWKPPGYSPYTEDQASAATLWCLLQRSGGTPESPLEVRGVPESKEDQPLAEKYSGIDVTRPGKDKIPVPPVKVPGTVLETDARGITWVTFPDEKRKPLAPPPEPGMNARNLLFGMKAGGRAGGRTGGGEKGVVLFLGRGLPCKMWRM